ncbi:MAG TPA: YccF domain-containing protein, partial [Myxococcota bacterium]
MRVLLNILWLTIGGGFVTALGYLLGGVVLCLTVVGIPFGVQAFKLAGLMLWPFGQDIVDDRTALGGGTLGMVMNVLWCIVAGVVIAITHLGLALGLAVTIIGIPFAVQHIKFA